MSKVVENSMKVIAIINIVLSLLVAFRVIDFNFIWVPMCITWILTFMSIKSLKK